MGMKKRTRRTDTSEEHTQDTTQDPPIEYSFSYAWTISGLIAFLNTLCHTLLVYTASLEQTRDRISMGIMDWVHGRKDEGEGEEMVPLGQQEEQDGEVQKGRQGDGTIKRRRHQLGSKDAGPAETHFPGMVNLSGTLCYMNSVLQAFASVTSLLSHLERIVNFAVEVDLPTPVSDALLEILYDLNTPQRRNPPALRPHALLHALQSLPAIRRLLSTREQQDAHELFLVLAEAVSNEAMKVAAEVATNRGLGEILTLQGYLCGKAQGVEIGKLGQDGGKGVRVKKRGLAMPWEGLMARRRVCKTCGWCETIRMDTLGGMELAIPQSGDVNVEDCIGQYLAPELLSDVTCEMCSLRQTHQHYAQDSERLSSPASSINGSTTGSSTQSGSFSALEHVKPNTNGIESNTPMTSSRKKRAKETKRVENRLKEMLDSGTITHFAESSIPASLNGGGPLSVKWQTVRTDSIREAAITRPPQSLRLHFIRSEYTPYGQLLKKNARVNFPLILDLTRFVANGVWEERNIMSMISNDTSQSPQPKVLYRLESAILHYGYNHSSGHYICIRRKPSPTNSEEGTHRPMPIKKSCQDGCRCDSCSWFGQVREEKEERGKGWLRISDADVDEVGIEALVEARAAVFMVFYEKVGEYEGGSEEKENGHLDGRASGLRAGQVDGRGSRESSI